jgi:RHS repeat-associated protein
LGNIRINYTFDLETSSLKILEENHYYPFGLKHAEAQTKKDIFFEKEAEEDEEWLKKISIVSDSKFGVVVPNSGYQYKYNGKEWQDELGLNVTAMDFRLYDNVIGRFNGMDLYSSTAPMWTPYRFAFNNPVYWKDPSGLFEDDFARCPTCPKTPKFQPYIDDPNNDYVYDADLDEAFIEIEGITVTANNNGNNQDWSEHFNNGLNGAASAAPNSFGSFYLNRSFIGPAPYQLNIHYTPKYWKTGNKYTFKPISAGNILKSGTIVTSVILEIPEIADGFEKSNAEGVKQTAGAVGGIGGGVLGGAGAGALVAATGASPTGPGAIVAGLIGAVVGAFLGEEGVERAVDFIRSQPTSSGSSKIEYNFPTGPNKW